MKPLTEYWLAFVASLTRDYGLDGDLGIFLPRKHFERLESEVFASYKVPGFHRDKGSPFDLYTKASKITFFLDDTPEVIPDP